MLLKQFHYVSDFQHRCFGNVRTFLVSIMMGEAPGPWWVRVADGRRSALQCGWQPMEGQIVTSYVTLKCPGHSWGFKKKTYNYLSWEFNSALHKRTCIFHMILIYTELSRNATVVYKLLYINWGKILPCQVQNFNKSWHGLENGIATTAMVLNGIGVIEAVFLCRSPSVAVVFTETTETQAPAYFIIFSYLLVPQQLCIKNVLI